MITLSEIETWDPYMYEIRTHVHAHAHSQMQKHTHRQVHTISPLGWRIMMEIPPLITFALCHLLYWRPAVGRGVVEVLVMRFLQSFSRGESAPAAFFMGLVHLSHHCR